jgi:anti-sigma regulatory factor (Ser/Thr protein kinase)
MPPATNETPSEANAVGTAAPTPPAADDKPDGKLTMDGFARWVLSAVDPDPARVPYLRHQAGLVLHLWRLDDVAWTVELLLTELASNVVRHARTLFNVGMVWDGHTLRGEVTDANPVPPEPEDRSEPDGTGGRGLMLVEELADRWGFDERCHGKTVWFEIKAA